ncbi:MAG TPA: Imm44 family immunity protein [Polyangiaceae bacterium]|nr:Imm44 family immunity protein [Polyangiaceae bacterium]
MSGEVEASVGERFRRAMLRVETALNEALESQTYDLALDSWDCIAVIRDDELFEELTRYSRKKRDVDFRLRIAHAEFLGASVHQQEVMIFEMLRRSLSILADKGLAGLELDRLTPDATRVAVHNGWA